MTLGEGHVVINVVFEYCDNVSGYGSVEANGNPICDDTGERVLQSCGSINPPKKKINGKKKQKDTRVVTPRNDKPA